MAINRFSQSTAQSAFPKFTNLWDGTTATSAMDAISFIQLSSATSVVEFNNITQTYTHLQLRVFANISTADAAQLNFNGDTGSNYKSHRFYGNGSTTGSGVSASATVIGIAATAGFASSTSVFGVSTVDILDYTNTNKYKTVRALSGWDNNSSGYVDFGSGAWFSTSAITSFTFRAASGTFIANSSFALYGVK